MGTICLFEMGHERFERRNFLNAETLTLESGATEPPGQFQLQSESWSGPTFHEFCMRIRKWTKEVAKRGTWPRMAQPSWIGCRSLKAFGMRWLVNPTRFKSCEGNESIDCPI